MVSAPSGAGKTSLCKEIIDIFPSLRHSVSYTTRSPRPGEVDGRDYFFTSKDEFQRMVDAGEFVEWAVVHGNLYGTALKTLEGYRAGGIDVILDIDWQGARQLKDRCCGGVFIFILPPSMEELRRRLDLRNSDTEENILQRLKNARVEMKESYWYDYVIVNDRFDTALEELRSIIVAERCRASRMIRTVPNLFE